MRYAQIRDELHESITKGELKPGDRLPPEIELSQRYQTSRATVAKALGELERAGLLSRRRGAGTFIKQPQVQAAPTLRIAMFTGWAMQGQEIGYFQTHIHAALSALCAERGAELSLQGLSAAGKDYRSQLFHAADQIIQRKTTVCCFCPAELPSREMAVNRELVDYLRSNGVAVVLIDRDIVAYPNRSDLPWVAFDNRRGATLLTRHVIEAGYRRIVFVGLDRESTAVEERLAGYTDALRLAGLPVDRKLIYAVDDQPDLEFCRRMLKEAKPDAIIAKDILFAAKIGSVLLSNGLKIGPDVGLAGFDDHPAASVLHVPLTIVKQPVEPFVQAVYQMVQRVVNQTYVAAEHIVVPTELVCRASTMRNPK